MTGSGDVFLLWKNDGNCCDLPVQIFSQQLRPDGRAVAGPARGLLASDQPWEAGVVEAPAMIEHDGTHYLFYSGNAWNTAEYAIGYATCTRPSGPCRKPLNRPWISSAEGVSGPGGLELFVDSGGQKRAVFHAWAGPVGYAAGGVHGLFTVGLDFVDGAPVTAS